MKRRNKVLQSTVCSWQNTGIIASAAKQSAFFLRLLRHFVPRNDVIRFVFLIFAYYLLPTAYSQVLSLDSVLSRIEKNNPALLSYTNKINSANELVNGAKAWMPPTVGIQWGENPYSFDFRNNTYQTMLFAEQWIPNTKRIRANADFLKSAAPIKQNEYGYIKNQLFSKAKESYYERYVSENRIQVMKDNIALMKNVIEISEHQMASGMSDMGSIYKMKARLADTENQLIQEEYMVKSLTANINYLMNADLNQEFSIDTNHVVKNYRNKTFLAGKDSLEQKRSDILGMSSQISSIKLNQTLSSMKSRTDYGIRFYHNQNFGGKDMLTSMNIMPPKNMYAIMFMMNIPIVSWSSHGYKSEVKAMGYEISAMEQDRQAMINMANQSVNMNILQLNAEYTEVENYLNKVVPAYKKSFDVNLLSYSQNTNDLMKVVLALDDLQEAQMQYITHIGLLLKAQEEYEKEMQIR